MFNIVISKIKIILKVLSASKLIDLIILLYTMNVFFIEKKFEIKNLCAYFLSKVPLFV